MGSRIFLSQQASFRWVKFRFGFAMAARANRDRARARTELRLGEILIGLTQRFLRLNPYIF
jgi:hypothetical protein